MVVKGGTAEAADTRSINIELLSPKLFRLLENMEITNYLTLKIPIIMLHGTYLFHTFHGLVFSF